jgi:hypothetical protein
MRTYNPISVNGALLRLLRSWPALFAAAALTGCSAGSVQSLSEEHGLAAPGLDPRKSLAVTDTTILSRFSLRAVLTQILASAGASATAQDVNDFYLRWWDTENPAAQSRFPTDNSHCDSPVGNGFPVQCPRAEGDLALGNSQPEDWVPIGLFNRFDLAPLDGSNCGEYRIVFAHNSAGGSDRILAICEGVLPNPNRAQCLQACQPVAQFWSDLTGKDINTRAVALSDFYFKGLPGFEPVVDAAHYGLPANGVSIGQIRTNQFMQPRTLPATQSWQLREFKINRTPTRLAIGPAAVRLNPFGPLFSDGADPQRSAFQQAFMSQLNGLVGNDLNAFTLATPATFDASQSDEQFFASNESDYSRLLGASFRAQIQAALGGTKLTAQNVVDRALTQSCAGCHELGPKRALGNGLVWPDSLGFTQITEQFPIAAPEGGARFRISPALTGTFLPHRKQVLESFLKAPPSCQPTPSPPAGGSPSQSRISTLGGATTH